MAGSRSTDSRSTDSRRRAYKSGQGAENLAAWWLRFKGYRIVARGFKTPVGEIDLVVRRGRVVAFVEVKIRRTRAEGADAIGLRQQARIARAAGWFLKSRPDFAALECRFDAVLVVSRRLPVHIPGAWDAGA
jgi:putative endonuclease